eukprot:2362616-Rhodomonas_salina.5
MPSSCPLGGPVEAAFGLYPARPSNVIDSDIDVVECWQLDQMPHLRAAIAGCIACAFPRLPTLRMRRGFCGNPSSPFTKKPRTVENAS